MLLQYSAVLDEAGNKWLEVLCAARHIESRGFSHEYFKKAGIQIYRTDKQGIVSVRSDGTNLSFQTEK